jgi:branched-subunit amino acid transport protein
VSTTAALIGGCAVVTFAIKAAGPVALGGRELPRWFTGIVVLLAPALLTALVVTQALAPRPRRAGGSADRGGRRRCDGGPARALVGA